MSAPVDPAIRIVVLAGEEFQRLERLRDIIEDTVDPATRDFNYDVLRGDELSGGSGDGPAGRLQELATTFPMMASRRVVVFRDFDRLAPDRRKKVAEVLTDIPDTTLVIIEGETVALTPKPKKHITVEQFKPVYERQLPGWIKERFRRRGKPAEDSVAGLLINNVGTVLGELDSEIEKIVVAAEDRDRITGEDAAKVVGAFKRDTIWNFTNTAGSGDLDGAAKILANLLDTEPGKETVYLSQLATHILKLAEYNRQRRNGTPHNTAMQVVTGSPFLWNLNRTGEQAERFSPRTVRRALTMLGRTESLMKKSAVSQRLLMELALPFAVPRRKP